MPDLVSLKSKPSDDEPFLGGDRERFPTLFLSDSEVEALGLTDAKVGDTLRLVANVKVTSTSMSEREEGETSRSVHLDLMEGATDQMPESDENMRASLLFGDG
jgi:hypothetical protein